ncbi:MAG: DUF3151 domain-containing protein [Actinomycetota bacterium]|nr:DUF3151 domain-containing protein [Actinomycetota bacterium]
MAPENLLGGPPETLLPVDPAAVMLADLLTDGADSADMQVEADAVARAHPASSLPWAVLAEAALTQGRDVEAYAFARTGYHRGLDALRRNGWGGYGPVPYRHEPNRGFLRALAALARAAERIGDVEEATRCREFLRDSSEEAHAELLGP